jgi:hypothetical protein
MKKLHDSKEKKDDEIYKLPGEILKRKKVKKKGDHIFL